MTQDVLIIANRGEVAVRVHRAAQSLGFETISIYSADDAGAMHQRITDRSVRVPGTGASAYLDASTIVRAAKEQGATLLHPGWGFLSEQPVLARLCADAGITFVGPSIQALEILGDKVRTRALAERLKVRMVTSTGPVGCEGAEDLLAQASPGQGIMLKAVAGGGGRGIRVVTQREQLASAYRDCAAEAANAFGDGRLFAEMYIPNSRHVEVQVIGDADGNVAVIGDRDCSVQRNWQKLIEIAPAPNLKDRVRRQLWDAARILACEVGYVGVGTFEFLVDASNGSDDWWFMEANPRLQVEHTITEEVTGIDIVQAQLNIARGSSLDSLSISEGTTQARGVAIQSRVNAETMTSNGVVPSSGRVTALTLPDGPGVRVDTGLAVGDLQSPRFDSLLAKVIVHEPTDGLGEAVRQARDAVAGLRVVGVETNQSLLLSILDDERLSAGDLSTRLLERHISNPEAGRAAKNIRVDDDGRVTVLAETAGVVMHINVDIGDEVSRGDDLVHVEVMKMHHVATAPASGLVAALPVALGEACGVGTPLVVLEPGSGGTPETSDSFQTVEHAGEILVQELTRRRQLTHDASRPDAVTETHARGRLTTREKIARLVEDGTFTEIGGLAVAARLWKETSEQLAQKTPADGVITGIGVVSTVERREDPGRCAVIAYDPSVLAGTQGLTGTQKVERLVDLASKSQLPVALMADGGGGRPGDDAPGTSASPLRVFHMLGRLAGEVPIVGMVSGACFAGNAAILGCSHVIVATRGANIGMGGPVVVDAARLGNYTVADIGPAERLHEAGAVDILVDDDAQAVTEVRRTLGYLQGDVDEWDCVDQSRLRTVLPADRLRAYDVRDVINVMADTDSVQELKAAYGPTLLVAFARLEGIPVGLIANNPKFNAGAIDGLGAEKATWFLKLCDSFGLPVIFLCDTPGFAVGPDAEATGQLRHLSSFLVAGSQLTVPYVTVITRKAYGVGALAMYGGSLRAPWMNVAWPSAEVGSMPPEAIVRLSAGRELDSISEEHERLAEFGRRVQDAKEKTDPIGAAARFRIDDVIDPMDTRTKIVALIKHWRHSLR